MLKKSWRVAGAIALASSIVTGPVLAAGTEREHGAHEHGHGALNVAVDGDELVIELIVPMVHVVGFEHAAETDAEKKKVEEAAHRFEDALALFTPTAAAACEVEEAEVEMAGLEHEGEHGHDDDHKHGKKHDEKHDEHDEKHAEDGEAHSELHATYHFHCDAPGKLESVGLKVFGQLDGLEELDAQIVTPNGQSAREIGPGDGVLSLK